MEADNNDEDDNEFAESENDNNHLHHTASMLNANTNQQTSHKRSKRQAEYEYTPTKTRCPLLLVADYRFFQEMGGGNTKTTINYLVIFYSFSFTAIYNYLYISCADKPH